MKKVLMLAATLLLTLTAFAQTPDLKAKAEADIAKLPGAWKVVLENPMDGGTVDASLLFIKDDKGVHFEMEIENLNKFVSAPLQAQENGKITTTFDAEDYNLVISNTIALTSDDAGELIQEVKDMDVVIKGKITRIKK